MNVGAADKNTSTTPALSARAKSAVIVVSSVAACTSSKITVSLQSSPSESKNGAANLISKFQKTRTTKQTRSQSLKISWQLDLRTGFIMKHTPYTKRQRKWSEQKHQLALRLRIVLTPHSASQGQIHTCLLYTSPSPRDRG